MLNSWFLSLSSAKCVRNVCGHPHVCDHHGRAFLFRVETALLHHTHLLPGADQLVPGHAAGENQVSVASLCFLKGSLTNLHRWTGCFCQIEGSSAYSACAWPLYFVNICSLNHWIDNLDLRDICCPFFYQWLIDFLPLFLECSNFLYMWQSEK